MGIALVVGLAGFGFACGDDNNDNNAVTGSNQVAPSPTPAPTPEPPVVAPPPTPDEPTGFKVFDGKIDDVIHDGIMVNGTSISFDADTKIVNSRGGNVTFSQLAAGQDVHVTAHRVNGAWT